MNSQDLEKLEETVYSEYNQDGAAECLMGGGLTLAGLGMATSSGFVWIIPILVVLFGKAWKRRITFPRLGYFEFNSKRSSMRRRGLMFMLIAVIAGLALAVWASEGHLFGESAISDSQSRLYFGGTLSIIIAMVAVVRKATVFYLIAAANFVFILFAYWLDYSGGYALIMTGILCLGFGLPKLARFLSTHPVIPQS